MWQMTGWEMRAAMRRKVPYCHRGHCAMAIAYPRLRSLAYSQRAETGLASCSLPGWR